MADKILLLVKNGLEKCDDPHHKTLLTKEQYLEIKDKLAKADINGNDIPKLKEYIKKIVMI